MKVHPTNIISGYKIAAKEACSYIENKLAVSVDKLGEEALLNCAKTSMSSKLINADPEFFGKLVVDSIKYVKSEGFLGGKPKYNIKSINILKAHGQSSTESQLIKGYAIQTVKAHQNMPTIVENAKIACLDFNLNKFRLQLGIQVLVDDPKKIEQIRIKECEVLRSRIHKMIEAGANVILTRMGIDDTASQYMNQSGVLGLRRVDKADLYRIAKLTGATVITTMATPEGEEVFDAKSLGECSLVSEKAVGDNDFVFFEGCKNSNACTIVLRGANEYMLDEVERYLPSYAGRFTTLSAWPSVLSSPERSWPAEVLSTSPSASTWNSSPAPSTPRNRSPSPSSAKRSTSSPRLLP
jgi:T-complex protein 1 subunit alpha